MKVVFTKTHQDEDGVTYKIGGVRELPDSMARKLIAQGVAQEHKEQRGPEETKESEAEPDVDDDPEDDGPEVVRK